MDILLQQPNGVIIGYSLEDSSDLERTPFHHLSRNQQLLEINYLLEAGIDREELERELYLVSHQPVFKVRTEFGLPSFLF